MSRCATIRARELRRRNMSETQHPRSIRSFVTRAGRITEAQQRALQELWPVYGVEFQPEPLDLQVLFLSLIHI